MWVLIVLGFGVLIALLFIILVCYLRSNERRIRLREEDIHLLEERLHLMDKRGQGQDIVIEKIYRLLLEIADSHGKMRETLRHHHISYPYKD